jgi:hypothetical protein
MKTSFIVLIFFLAGNFAPQPSSAFFIRAALRNDAIVKDDS